MPGLYLWLGGYTWEHTGRIFLDNSYNINKTYLSQAEYFINKLKNNDPYMNNLDESFEILKIALHE